MGSVITKIEKYSPLLHKAKIGDTLVSINGKELEDVLDYKFFSYDPRLELVLESENGQRRTVRVKKDAGSDLGLEFTTYLMDRARACKNRCVFCFVDQLPRGLRKTLYFKDDDARLSFLTGNYITLTNLSEREIQRIIDLRISPINVSVHATEPELRATLLGNPEAANGYELLNRLASGGITMNCQIVCCPGLNDGDALSRSMTDLAALYPQVNSVSIVPVGLTKHRERLFPLKPFDRDSAAETLDRVNAFGDVCLEKHASRIFFPSDELFLKAERQIPEDVYYEDYTQLENGVGLLRLLQEEFSSALENEDVKSDGVPFSIATGVSAAPFLAKLLVTAKQKHDNIKGRVFPVINDFFGHTIDVAGLVTGRDLINQLRNKDLGARLLIPHVMLRDGEGIFLDDVTVSEVEKELQLQVIPIGQDGSDLFLAMTGNFSLNDLEYPKK
ncbi:MAG: radical SAM protein [Firmicutes bacterium HGW-Firmicutes-16]|nr:MAG: radical SAM protein [Firmicutes bacterium HGW-Firmicutes-16]